MIIDDLNLSVRRQSSYGVAIDDIDTSGNFSSNWSTTHDADAAFASATLEVILPFTLETGRHEVKIYAGWNTQSPNIGDNGYALVFAGEITALSNQYWRRHDTFTCGGYLSRTNVGLDQSYAFATDDDAWEEIDTLFYTAVDLRADPTDAAIIVYILEKYGITPSTTGHRIEASDWQPAKLLPIYWDAGTPGIRIIQELDLCSPNYRTSDAKSGIVERRQLFGTVPDSVKHTFTQGIDILDLRVDHSYDVSNKVIVRGATYDVDTGEEEGEDAVYAVVPGSGYTPSPYIPNPPGVRIDERINSQYIETVPDAAVIGGHLLGRLEQPLHDYTLTTFGCPDIDLGFGLGVVSTVMDVDVQTFVASHTISGSPLRSVLRLRGSTDADTRTNQPPYADFTLTVVSEHVLIDDVLTSMVLITFDMSTSADNDGEILFWELTVEATVYSGTGQPGTISHVTTSASPITATLVVTDDQGLEGTYTRSIAWSETSILAEPLVVAEAIQAEATLDEVTWNVTTADVTAVAPIALGGTTLYGTATGQIYRSTTQIATTPTLIRVLSASQVNAIWCNEKYLFRWYVGLENGEVWLSIDDGLTWVLRSTLGAAINDIAESPFAAGQVTVAAGNNLWFSYDAAAAFEIIVSHSTTCLRFAAGAYGGISRTYVGFDDGVVKRYTPGSPIGTTEVIGTVPGDFPIKGLTLDRQREVAYVFTDQADSPSYSLVPDGTFTEGPTIPTAANYAIRSGTGQWVYVATDAALVKALFAPDFLFDIRLMPEGGQALRVGYGMKGKVDVTPPPEPGNGEILLLTNGNAPVGNQGVWHNVPDVGWTLKNTGLPQEVGLHWDHLAINPFHPDEWLLLGNIGTKSTLKGLYNDPLFPGHKILGGATSMMMQHDHWKAGDVGLPLGGVGTPKPPLVDPLWYTDDAGLTWRPIALETVAGFTYHPSSGPAYTVPFISFAPENIIWGNGVDDRSFAMIGALGYPSYSDGGIDAVRHGILGYVTCKIDDSGLPGTTSTDDDPMLATVNHFQDALDDFMDQPGFPDNYGWGLSKMVAAGSDPDDATLNDLIYIASNTRSAAGPVLFGNLIDFSIFAPENYILGVEVDGGPGSGHQIAAVATSGRPSGTPYGTTHYRDTAFAEVGPAVFGRSITVAADGVYVAGKTPLYGLWFCPGTTFWDMPASSDDFTAAGIVQVADLAGKGVTFVRSDRRTHDLIAARIVSSTDVWYFDGDTWALVPGPVGVGNGIGGTVQVVNRES